MSETERRLEQKEAERAEKRKEKSAQKAEKGRPDRAKVKKWKGKDWFAVLSPKVFGEMHLADTPAMDPKSISNRAIEVSVPEITGNESKYYMKLRFKIERIEDRKAYTRFGGLSSTRDYISRMTRKGSSKIRMIGRLNTKDGWELRASLVAILLKNTDASVQKRVRENMMNLLKTNANKSTIDFMIKSIINGFAQKAIKKSSSRIYPVRFLEIEKIEVLKAPSS